ncbi:uncharacterized protein FA14DRAFT_80969 [Meira miltonrushii]|uniref:Uncharacterized protein n=1 Tax=Meira miltonrushii TaxID=1280837 RepID=A0A316V6L5_9BASI|nr:uncharacterized protein FA14DRAFT_80969 [Meira miltonrushii]PWN33062.1 hypothetical protein FA14DRAFT_80969 [Meira miltonrushii]
MSKRPSPGVDRARSPPNKAVSVPPIRFATEQQDKKYQQQANKVATKQGKSVKVKQRSRGGGFFSWLFRLAFRLLSYYTVFCALFTCGSHPFSFDYSTKDQRAVCRNLAHAKIRLVPIATPILKDTYAHIDPYAGPYIRAATPVVQKAYKISKPHYIRAYKYGNALYKKHVDPARKRAIKRAHAYADPHVKKLQKEYKKQVQPHVDNLHKTVKPYRDIYTRDVAPYVKQAHIQSIAAAYASHHIYVHQVHPHILTGFKHSRSFYFNHFLPAVRRAYVLYIQPQQDKITARIFGYTPDRTVKVEKPTPMPGSSKESVASVVETVQETVKSAASGPIETVKSATEAASSLLAETFEQSEGDEDEEDPEELDRQLDAEVEQVTAELESWEKGMSKLIREETRAHKQRIKQGTLDDAGLEQARNASVVSVRRYFRKARKAFEKVMEDVKFEVTVDDFEGWDRGLNVRVKLFAQDLIQLEKEMLTKNTPIPAEPEAQESAATEPENAHLVEKLAAQKPLVAESQTSFETETISEVIQEDSPAEPIVIAPESSASSSPEVEADLSGTAKSFEDKSTEEEAPVSGSPSEAEDPTFSILPIEVADEKGTPAKATEVEDEKEPSFSILPIEVVDEKGTPAEKKEKPAHEEL